MEVVLMSSGLIAWVTHAPADYILVFSEDPDGEHAAVSARFEDAAQARAAGQASEGVAIDETGTELCTYCTLPGEADRVRERFREASALKTWVERGTIAFVAVGDGSGTSLEAAGRRRNVTAWIVLCGGGDGPRCYRAKEQCATCGEFLGKINVVPQGEMVIDTRELSCRCVSIPCRYCDEGRVRRPLTEHLDPERRAGRMPWYGYLVPCGRCQATGWGPKVLMST
jgi:hypothetical protein